MGTLERDKGLSLTVDVAAAEDKFSPGIHRAGQDSVDDQKLFSRGRRHERLHKPLLHPAGKEDENKLEGFQQAEARRMGG